VFFGRYTPVPTEASREFPIRVLKIYISATRVTHHSFATLRPQWGKPPMENYDSRPHRFTRRVLLGTATTAALGAYGFSQGLAAEVPDVFDGTQWKLRAPELNAKRSGVLRYGLLSAPAHFDVHQSGTVSNVGTQGCMYDNLIRRDPRDSGQSIIPDLAHSWEIAQDGKTYTFFLRKGVKFHDGGDLTADAT
jgi:peptide/nickel transport system substrate-binding protein